MQDIIDVLSNDQQKMKYQEQGISFLGLFGSVATGDEVPSSDVDLLISFNKPRTLFDLARVKFYFQELLGRKVDLALRERLKQQLKPYIESQLITLYEEN